MCYYSPPENYLPRPKLRLSHVFPESQDGPDISPLGAGLNPLTVIGDRRGGVKDALFSLMLAGRHCLRWWCPATLRLLLEQTRLLPRAPADCSFHT